MAPLSFQHKYNNTSHARLQQTNFISTALPNENVRQLARETFPAFHAFARSAILRHLRYELNAYIRTSMTNHTSLMFWFAMNPTVFSVVVLYFRWKNASRNVIFLHVRSLPSTRLFADVYHVTSPCCLLHNVMRPSQSIYRYVHAHFHVGLFLPTPVHVQDFSELLLIIH